MNALIQFEAVIFDMDGLMLDTERIARVAWQHALAEWGYELSFDSYTHFVGRTEHDTEVLLRQFFGNAAPVHELRQRKTQLFEAAIAENGIPIKPGVMSLLDHLEQQETPKAVASSSYRNHILTRLQTTQLLGRFEVLVGGDEVEHGKPAPDIFLEAVRRLQAPPRQCLVLEDSEAGIQAAHAAGAIPIMVPDIKAPSKAVAALAYRVLPSLDDVFQFL